LAGEIFKKKREELGIEIKEASDILKIGPEYLSAIENDIFDKLPVAVYTLGYIRCYAKYLDVDAESAIANFTSHLSSPKPSTIIPVFSSTQKVSIYFYVMLVLLAGVTVFAIYTCTGKNRNKAITVEKVIPSVKQKIITPPAPVAVKSVPARKTADSIPMENKIHEAVPAGMDKDEHRLAIKSLDNVWMRISFENGKKEEVLLRAGISRKWEFRGAASLRIGNAGGVLLNFDGKELGVPGAPGQALNLTFPQS
jgi:hypothetical protein